MPCNHCEESFNSEQSIVVSTQRSGGTARLSLANGGRNVVLVRRTCSAARGRPPVTCCTSDPRRFEADRTHVYFSAEKSAADDIAAAMKATSAPAAVDAADVARLERTP